MKKLVIGILAHVDAGKTTLAEGMLYLSGKIKKQGRVDNGDTCLDNHALERARGITIFSKQAVFDTPLSHITLLDTPGHIDFSSEMERTLQVLDYAILVISGTDGVQAHTETLWRLLKRYDIPALIFVTKMDLCTRDKKSLMDNLRSRLGEGCIDFTCPDMEEIAVCDEAALEKYSEKGALSGGDISGLIKERKLFPCFFGSGLKLDGVSEFTEAIDKYTVEPRYAAEFSARIFKIARDGQGSRLTYMKITGGELKVRSPLAYAGKAGDAIEEKISGIRFYSGAKYETADSVSAGTVCAVTGLSQTYPGQGLGAENAATVPVLEPVLTYRVILPSGCDAGVMLSKLRELEDEDPMLHIVWNGEKKEIHVQLMGRVQIEILKSIILERFGVAVEVDAGKIMYRETIAAPVEGVGHFEPLRHYAEVHLLMEPLPRGSGIIFDTCVSEDILDRNWQRLILSNLEEKQHLGVLTGSPITDIKITLTAGRAHLKHTEGGDFRQAAWRAVRQGLMRADSVLLEPYYAFRLEVPQGELGRAINDIRAMNGTLSAPESVGEMSVIEGRAPVAAVGDYAADVAAYSRGRGRFSCRLDGYEECKNSAAVIAGTGYDACSDLDNTPDSVFCAHGAGFTVKWDKVPEYMHLDTGFGRDAVADDMPIVRMRNFNIDEKELEAIMDREFGPIRRPMYSARQVNTAPAPAKAPPKKEYIFVDGYNVIFAWEELKALAQDDLSLARQQLMDILANYRGYSKCELVLVFDAYRVPGGEGSRLDYHGIHLAYTKQGETCDAYIERLAKDIGKNYAVRVVSSDSLIQLSALGSGVLRETVSEFRSEVSWVLGQIESAIARMDMGMRGEKLGDRMKFDGEQ